MTRNLLRWPQLVVALAAAALVLGVAFSPPAVADGLGTLLQRLHLREIQSSPPTLTSPPISTVVSPAHPGGVSYGDTIGRQTTFADATAYLDFALLVPTFVPPGYAAIRGPATLTSGNRQQVRLTYQNGNDAAASQRAITIIEDHRPSGSAAVRPYDVKPGSAQAVRISELDGVYVSGDWVPGHEDASRERTSNLHFVVFEHSATEIWIYASPSDVTKSELLDIAASLRPFAPSA
ncbi:MAG: hypothetical protein ACRDIY_07360 [Chloroflexota bacterium]